MQKKLLLLKLRLCDGISFRGENLVYQWLIKNPEMKRPLSTNDIIKIAKIKFNCQKRFKTSFNSPETINLIKYNIKNVHWITIFDVDYPALLREINNPPLVLFYLGNWELMKRRKLAVVGARQNTIYTNHVLKGILPMVVNKGICVVSGLAKGVDYIAHKVTLQNGGHTIAIIGTGLDQYYPKENQKLQRYIASNQLLISEYPLGTGVRKYHFPERNRIIAGLVENVLITEAKKKSGSLITADLALDFNRNVLAVPGPINSSLSVGCNELIKEGAQPILCAQDILNQFFDLTF